MQECVDAGFSLDGLPSSMSEANPRVEILQEALEIVGKRGLNYGTPEDNFARIARRWTVHLKNRYDIDLALDDIDVAVMCADLKFARIENEPLHHDSWVDACGYSACGGGIAKNRRTQCCAEAAKDKE